MKLTRHSASRKSKSTRGSRRTRRLRLENLEDRRLLAFGDPIINVPGQFQEEGSLLAPPDTTGDVGKDYFIQAVNDIQGSVFTIYDKTDGEPVRGPIAFSDFAQDECEFGLGDPIVLYDHLAERWVLTEFFNTTLSGGTGPQVTGVCVLVSQTSDPTNDLWHAYQFETQLFPDYPKWSVWPDGYYFTTNENELGVPVPSMYALDRENMIQGLPARPIQRFSAPPLQGAEYGFQALTPADLDGPAPPVGTGGYSLRHVDDEVHFGVSDGSIVTPNDFIEIWQFNVNFDTPRLSGFKLHSVVQVPDFDSLVCGDGFSGCVTQPGTGQLLDPIALVIMQRLQYRNFGTHETIVGNHTIDVNRSDDDLINRAGVHWFELRKDGNSGWVLHQDGIVAGSDNNHRWMGAAAMDGQGNIAIGYNISGPSRSPSLVYTGREVDDPLGTMLQGEHTLVHGQGAQDGTNRWGDYSQLGIDPVDDSTFWFTGEWIDNGEWATQISSWQFPAPPPPPPTPIPPGPGTISGIKYIDLDGDGNQDPNEPGLGGIFIYVDQDNDSRIALEEPKAITADDGTYTIPVPTSGTFVIREVATPGFIQTEPGGSNLGYTVNISPGSAQTGIDFGNQPAVDFGDADSAQGYATTIADGGASHGILQGFSLGAEVDAEQDGQPDAAALGDDSNGFLDDEDGIVIADTLRSDESFTVQATITNTVHANGYVQGFIDFNGNGSFSDPGEQIITNELLGAGVHTLGPFSVPSAITAGTAVARFRLSHRLGLGPDGPAFDGEVEDYAVTLLANIPVANPDAFSVAQGAQSVLLDVLANDLPSTFSGNTIIPPPGQASIVGSAGGLIQIGPGGQEIFYTPVQSFAGTETFTYGITDTANNVDTALVSVQVIADTDDPVAVDDSFPNQVFEIASTVPINQRPEYTLDVLANDLDGRSGAAILANISVSPSNGTARVENGVIIYQPNPDFGDFDQFNYRLLGDPNDPNLEATVSIQIQPNAAANDRAQIIVNPLQSNVTVGDTFQVEVLVRDIRSPSSVEPGVAAAYLDLLYESALVSVVPDGANALGFDIDFNGPYSSAITGDALTLGVLNEVGATQGGTSGSVGLGPKTLFIATFRANAVGTVDFTSDPADLTPASDMVVLAPVEVIPPNQITYGFGSVTIDAAAGGEGELARFHNIGNPNDVNVDGTVSSIDALIVINSLNNEGPRKLDASAEAEGSTNGVKLDVNNDGWVTPIDALLTISYLNHQAGGEGEGEGEFVEAIDNTQPIVATTPDNLALGTVEVQASLITDAEGQVDQLVVTIEDDEDELDLNVAPVEEDAFAELGDLISVDDAIDELAEDVAGLWNAADDLI